MPEIKIFNSSFRRDVISPLFLAVSDPPYNQNYHYGGYKDNLPEDDYALLLRDAFAGRRSVVVHYPEETINLLSKILGKCEQVVVWVYNSNTGKQSRLVSWWNCKPDFSREGQAYKNPKDKRIAKRIEEGKQARLYDWWYIDQVKNVSKTHSHPCPVPVELMRRIISITAGPGDVIYDPFSGSGTTALACLLTGHDFVGYEIDSKYFAESLETIEKFKEETYLKNIL